jgi:acetyltransferase-like isoleucine patch superfamily enzyme
MSGFLSGCLDIRLIWSLRYFLYKLFAGRLPGIGYLGQPSFVKGFNHFYSGPGFGIFPGWRIEITRGNVEVGRDVRIGNNFFLNCGSKVSIGDRVTISSNVFIGTTDVEINEEISIAFKDWRKVERPVLIGSNCFIGYGAVLLPGTVLGDGCVVGANAVVRGCFKSGSIVAGNPARILRIRI